MPTWDELIQRARVYVADDNAQEESWIDPAKWLVFGNVELQNMRTRWSKMGLVNPATTDLAFTTATVSVPNAMAIVGVAENLGTSTPYRVLVEAQSGWGATPYWGTPANGRAQTWAATGIDGNFVVTLDPPDTGHNYIVRYAPNYVYATDPTTSPVIPAGADERLVLGMAKRAHIKDSTRSAGIQDLINEQDALLMFTAFGQLRNDGPRVRRVSPRVKSHQSQSSFPSNPRFWRYP